MYKVAVIGDLDSIYGFSGAGLEVFPAATAAEGLQRLRQLVAGEYAIIYLTEAYYTELDSALEEYRTLPFPAVIPIPGIAGNTGLGRSRVKGFVERAVGADILFGDKE